MDENTCEQLMAVWVVVHPKCFQTSSSCLIISLCIPFHFNVQKWTKQNPALSCERWWRVVFTDYSQVKRTCDVAQRDFQLFCHVRSTCDGFWRKTSFKLRSEMLTCLGPVLRAKRAARWVQTDTPLFYISYLISIAEKWMFCAAQAS